ncbi:hypothetical protein [Stappia sp.]|uniref:hypothetical protein n=1 Tax=Stappia sp. TaxID=1870903 RepID=UPI003C7A2931
MKLTGRIRYRRDWRGRLILQVQYQAPLIPRGRRQPNDGSLMDLGWRDARIEDLQDFGGRLRISQEVLHDD